MITFLTYAAGALLLAVIYFLSLGFERSGLGGKQRTFRSDAIESLVVATVGAVAFWLTDLLAPRFGITNPRTSTLILFPILLLLLFGIAIPYFRWRRWRKRRRRETIATNRFQS
ncbi:MAG TPA: hypothetical protein VLA96_06930 [Terriglobales bacterium]|nr:hypothetical protein [Terriglobales bacterium]